MPGIQDTLAALARYQKPQMPPFPGSKPSRLVELKTFGANPGNLRMLAYKPASLERGAPLVVVLHGCTQTAEGYAEGAGWLALADRYGFAVVCPEQRTENNLNRCFNWFNPADTARGEGEAESIRSMIGRSLADRYLDADRVFITGLSAGGAMTSVMLATYPELFAAGAVVAGLPYGAADNVQEAFLAMSQSPPREAAYWGDHVRAASSHKGPWPRVAIWHGDVDATVKVDNADAIAAQWANVHGLEDASLETALANGHRRRTWVNAKGQPLIESFTLAGMGHGAPLAVGGAEGCGSAGPFLIEIGISSSLEIARFWGIAEPSMRMAAGIPAKPADAAPRPKTGPVPPNLSSGSVIVRALRAAGLMK